MNTVRNDSVKLIRTGWLVISFGLAMVIGWGAFASLESAALADGVLEPSSGVQRVQHLEGGIIKSLNVKEGDRVKKGDLLLTLDDTQAKSQFERIAQRLRGVMVEGYRLKLELNQSDWTVNEEFTQADFTEYVQIQKKLFDARREAYLLEHDILAQKVDELNNEAVGLNKELAATRKQQGITQKQINDLQALVSKNLVKKTDLMKLESSLAEFQGKAGRLTANIARVKQAIGEARLTRHRLEPRRFETISAEIKRNRDLLNDLAERQVAASDILQRKTIHAESDGRITELAVKDAGEIINKSQLIMKIVPDNDALVIKARIKPDDIDVVKPGQAVDIRFTAYSNRRTHPVEGTITQISADRKQSEDGSIYYESIVEMNKQALDKSDLGELHPGMSAQLAIINGKRRVWEYFVDPVLNTTQMALREN